MSSFEGNSSQAEAETQTETERNTLESRDIETKSNMHEYRQTWTHIKADRHTLRQTDLKADRQTDRQTHNTVACSTFLLPMVNVTAKGIVLWCQVHPSRINVHHKRTN